MYTGIHGGVSGMLNLFVLLHAGDTIIMVENECDMQRNLHLLNECCECNGLRVNISKAKNNSLCQDQE